MTWLGYKRPLTADDLWDINTEDASNTIVPMFTKYWNDRAMKNFKR